MKENFSKTLKDSKRKNYFFKAIEKYKRFKSLGKMNIPDITDSLNNSFTNGINQNKKRQKSIERIYRMKNNYNIIFEMKMKIRILILYKKQNLKKMKKLKMIKIKTKIIKIAVVIKI